MRHREHQRGELDDPMERNVPACANLQREHHLLAPEDLVSKRTAALAASIFGRIAMNSLSSSNKSLLREKLEAQAGRADPAVVALALTLVDDAPLVSIDPTHLPAAQWHHTYWIRARRWERHGALVPGLADALAAFTRATTDLRAVGLMRTTIPSWVGILWFDADDALVAAVDLRALID